MDGAVGTLHYRDMSSSDTPLPAYDLYGEHGSFPDIMHCERIVDRATALDWRIPPHRHGVLHQFFHLEQPGARATVEGQSFVIDRSCVLSVPRFHAHAFAFPPGQRGHVLSVRPDTLPDLFGDAAELPDAFFTWRMVEADAALGAAFGRIRHELLGNAPLRAALLRATVVEIAAAVLRSAPARLGADRGGPALAHMRRFERLVQANAGARRSVAWYAERLAMTPKHLGRITALHAGLSPGRFVEDAVMREARRQLAYTRLPVAAVGYALGYDDPAYFSRVFRRHEGLSPTEYRRATSDFR